METVQLSWDDAEAFCTSKAGGGWNLAIVQSDMDNSIFESLVSTDWGAWVGLAAPIDQRSGDPPNQISAQHSGKFVWADGSVSSYRNWVNGEPNNYNGGGEARPCCIALTVFSLALSLLTVGRPGLFC